MQCEEEKFENSISTLQENDLRILCCKMHRELSELKSIQLVNERIYTEAHVQYAELMDTCNRLQKENSELKKVLEQEISKNKLRAKSCFGKKTEKLLDTLTASEADCAEFEDEAQEEDAGLSPSSNGRVVNLQHASARPSSGQKRGHRHPLVESMNKLPKRIVYNLDMDDLNARFGVNNWRIANWHAHHCVEKIPVCFFHKITYTPVISEGLEHIMHTEPYENPLLDRTVATASLTADFSSKKFALGLPYNRLAKDYAMNGLALSKQTMLRWTNLVAVRYLKPVVEHLTEELLKEGFSQCDETFLKVNEDQRKGYMWVHSTSSLSSCKPVIIFSYEPTRGTDHLRSFYSEFMGYITCDAYISYQVLEKERPEEIRTSGCWMHCRRYLAEALFINNLQRMSNEEQLELPETKALLLIREIYHQENPLKCMTAEQRHELRQQKVKPCIDAFFAYIHQLKADAAAYSDRLNKAISYAINQEDHLRVFLQDGNIPMDNGHPERIIASYSRGRASWLFADTVQGAEVYAIMYSVVETAKANNVNVRLYLQYLFEEMPKHASSKDRSYLEDMVPWSDAYQLYARKWHETTVDGFCRMFPKPDRPRTPRKQLLKAS